MKSKKIRFVFPFFAFGIPTIVLIVSVYLNLSLEILVPLTVLLAQAVIVFLEKKYPLILESSQDKSDWKTDFYHLVHGAISHEFFRAIFRITFKGIIMCLVYLLVGSEFIFSFESVSIGKWNVVIQFLMLYIVSDLYYYVFHRLMHEKELLWPWHTIHHATEKMYSMTVTRKHSIDVAIRFAPPIPIFLLLGIDMTVFMIYTAHALLLGMLQHANININFSGWNKVFATADTHHVHHAKDSKMGNHNYGNGLIIFDRIFGTYLNPDKIEKVDNEFGLNEQIPASFLGQMLYPLKLILNLRRNK